MTQQPPQDKFTAEQVAEALRKSSGIKAAAARALGCDWKTVDRYVRTYATVRQAHDEATEVLLDVAEGHLASAVRRGEWEQVKYYLNAKGKSRGYGIERRQVENDPIDWALVDDDTLDAYCDGKLSIDDVRRSIIRQSRTR